PDGLEACLDGVRARRAVHVADGQCDGSLTGNRRGREDQSERDSSAEWKLGHWEVSVHELRNRGAMMSRPSATRTTTVAAISPALTSRFGSGRAQAAPSVQAPLGER